VVAVVGCWLLCCLLRLLRSASVCLFGSVRFGSVDDDDENALSFFCVVVLRAFYRDRELVSEGFSPRRILRGMYRTMYQGHLRVFYSIQERPRKHVPPGGEATCHVEL
jgi:hypothetical protein